MPRGGKRPGAGAPSGNLNRLNHGRRSKQIQKAVEKALEDPKGRVTITTLVRKYNPTKET